MKCRFSEAGLLSWIARGRQPGIAKKKYLYYSNCKGVIGFKRVIAGNESQTR